MNGIITITDGIRTIEAPYEEGETIGDAMTRVVRFPLPCGGWGLCGRCKITVVRPDGTEKEDLACIAKAKDVTVKLFCVHEKE